MRSLDYQRTIIAYHGCDESVVRKTLLTGEPLAPSEHDYDWLGTGIYFWEFGPERALDRRPVARKLPKATTSDGARILPRRVTSLSRIRNSDNITY
jgi:hypothetical protein